MFKGARGWGWPLSKSIQQKYIARAGRKEKNKRDEEEKRTSRVRGSLLLLAGHSQTETSQIISGTSGFCVCVCVAPQHIQIDDRYNMLNSPTKRQVYTYTTRLSHHHIVVARAFYVIFAAVAADERTEMPLA